MIFEDGYVKISDFGLAKKNIQGKHNKTILGNRNFTQGQGFTILQKWCFGKGMTERLICGH